MGRETSPWVKKQEGGELADEKDGSIAIWKQINQIGKTV